MTSLNNLGYFYSLFLQPFIYVEALDLEQAVGFYFYTTIFTTIAFTISAQNARQSYYHFADLVHINKKLTFSYHI